MSVCLAEPPTPALNSPQRRAEPAARAHADGSRRSNPKGKLDVLCDGVGIRIIPVHRRRGPSQTHARGMLKEIRQQHGDAHLVMVLRCLKETGENRHALWSETIGALSDVLVQRPDWLERPSDLFAVLDGIDLNDARQRALERRPWPVRQTLRARLYETLAVLMG